MNQSHFQALASVVSRRKIGGLSLDAEVTLFVAQGGTSLRQALHDAGVSFCCLGK